MSPREPSPYRLEVVEGMPRGDLYELEQTTVHRIVDTRSGKVVMTFEGLRESRLDGGLWDDGRHTGVIEVTLLPDQGIVRVRHHDGRVETLPLPARDGMGR